VAVPRPWWSSRAKDLAPYAAGVAHAMALLLVIVQMVPADPRAHSHDDLGRTGRLDIYRIKPSVTPPPPPTPAARGPSGGGAPTTASGPTGTTGDRRARPADSRRASKGPAPTPQDARAVEQYVRDNSLLAILDGPRGQALTHVLSTTPALGHDTMAVLSDLRGQTFADAYGHGFGPTGTGAGGADTGRALRGGAPGLGTIGRHGGKDGGERGYGDGVGPLARRQPRELTIVPQPALVRGGLDKEIVRRVVRAHLNEVRYCYERSLVRRPSLAGRVVVNFTIAPAGRVLASVLQSSTLGDNAVEACVVDAIRRWDFPKPDGGGVVIVSYPFQLTPAGG
jgi:TonB family protein